MMALPHVTAFGTERVQPQLAGWVPAVTLVEIAGRGYVRHSTRTGTIEILEDLPSWWYGEDDDESEDE